MRYTGGVTRWTCLIPALLMMIAAAPPPSASRAPVLALDPSTEQLWVPFDLTPGNQIRFQMALDGHAVTAVLDTGVSVSVLASHYAEVRKLTVSAHGRADVIGGTVDVGQVATGTLAIGGLTRRGGTLAVAPLPAAATGSATAVDVLVGRDLTAGFALDIDYAQRRFRLLPSGRVPFTGVSAPLAIAPNRQVYVSAITLGGAVLRPMIVDTGDGSAVTLGRLAWTTAGVAAGATTSTVSYGLGGAVVSDLAVVPMLSVGQMVARNVEVRVEPSGGFSDAVGVAGRIGSGFLQNYRVLLDPAAGHMLLARGDGADLPPPRSTSGLLVGLGNNKLKVLHVMRGGPAAATGWRNGDTICTIDGAAVPADYAVNPLARWSTGVPGRTVALGLCDGVVRQLTLREFY